LSGLRIGVLEGDGIGKEVIPATVVVLDAVRSRLGDTGLETVHVPIGWDAIRASGTPVPDETVDELTACDAWILGPHDNQAYPEKLRQSASPSGVLRKHFDLYANYRPSRAIPGANSVKQDIDVLVVRENTEGLYSDRNMFAGAGEFKPSPDVALTVGVFTRPAIERVAHAAFRAARERRKHVTVVHKANVLRMTMGLFLSICNEVAEEYPDVQVDDFHVDAMASHLIRHPARFDVLVCENLFGDVLSELAAELAGGLGVAASLNAGDRWAMAQATHGAAPDIAGRNIANPVAEMLSLALLLGWLGQRNGSRDLIAAGKSIELALERTLRSGVRTADLGGSASTSEFGQEVARALVDSLL
jgi:3-isopropylmalate dehydrogenase